MEVTDLKGLKNLMKADASTKFEFVEDNDVEHFNKGDMFYNFSAKGGAGGASFNKNGTYNTYNPRSSRLSKNID